MSAEERASDNPRASRGKGWRIAARLRVIIAAPLVAVFGFAGLALANTIGQAQAAGRLGEHVMLAADAGTLAYDLELERAAAAAALTANGQTQLDAYNQQVAHSDAAASAYQRQWRASAAGTTPAASAVLGRIGDELSRLGQLREQVRFGAQASVSATTFGYRIVIADLLAYRESVAQAAASAGVADNMRAAAALAEAIEAAGQQQVAVVRAVAAGQLTPSMQSDIIATRASFTESSLTFQTLAPVDWQAWWEQASTGPVPLAAQKLQDQVARAVPGQPVNLDTTAWIDALAAWTSRLFDLEQRVDGVVGDEVDAARQAQVDRAGVEFAATILALLLTVLVTTVVARRISRRLERLRDSANDVAFSKLPAVVEELRLAEPASVRPELAADRAAPYPERVSGDEIGEVGLAFTHVHRAAVRTAAEQAVMRANMAEIFVHLSRREQRLVDAVLAQVDEVERDETNPTRLESLYKLDNLATRMARINSSLLVLGGAGAGRVRHEDVPLVKVLQAALSQIEHYRRVRIGMIDDGVALVSESVDELVHLLAELLDNATLYSPPDSEAWMTARALHDRVVIQIGDEGVGLPSQRREELNALLRRPPAIDVAAVRAMGLTVVGHLAMRYGVRVELRPGPKLGTIAEVNIPLPLTRPIPGIAALAAASRGTGTAPMTVVPPKEAALTNGHSNGANGNGTHGNGANGKGNGHRPRRDGRPQVPPSFKPPPPGAAPAPTAEPDAAPAEQSVLSRTAPMSQPPPPDVDDTAELPIFQQVNGWFRSEVGEDAADWRTAADEAWRQAERAAQAAAAAEQQTKSGLPVRVRGAHLVPGGVDVP
ncbi:MAG TPA: nitrate- and nitrite sensing domain-containing protein, partial [Rugosimonospora sp.]|nr:nitrate- and nitrite sensing domain-containing protein [Rugosimonospora sp.]